MRLTESYCKRCAHPHRYAVGRLVDVIVRCPSRGCGCKKFIPLPSLNGKMLSMNQWKDVTNDPRGPTNSSPLHTRKNRLLAREWKAQAQAWAEWIAKEREKGGDGA